ncbi:hypothetical protein DIPPA_32188 [Diplonema papillatum]|nr:hypothetical protein DIPPA_32188 [Diplonema papillatum]
MSRLLRERRARESRAKHPDLQAWVDAKQVSAADDTAPDSLRFNDTSTERNARYPGACFSRTVHDRKALASQKGPNLGKSLWNASWDGDLDIIRRALTRKRADANAPGLCSSDLPGYERGRQRLHYGLVVERSQVAAPYQLRKKRFARVRCSAELDYGYAPPLHWAVAGGRKKAVACLLANGADPLVAASCGASALHIACGNYHVGVIVLLLSHISQLGSPRLVKRYLTPARGNPYDVLYQALWLDPSHKDFDDGAARESQLSLAFSQCPNHLSQQADGSGSDGVALLQHFLRTAAFEQSVLAALPVPPYTFRPPFFWKFPAPAPSSEPAQLQLCANPAEDWPEAAASPRATAPYVLPRARRPVAAAVAGHFCDRSA